MNGQQPWEIQPSEAYWQALLARGESPLARDLSPWLAQADDAAGDGFRSACGGGPVPWNAGHGSGRHDESWATLAAWHASGTSFVAPVIGCNKGGLLVRVSEGIGFVPASQLAQLPDSLGTAGLRGDLESMVGRELRLRLIEVDRARNRVICSERATQFVEGDIEARLDALERCLGCTVEGTVRSLCDFGAFVDLGGIDGLIHISELSWRRIGHPVEVVAVSQPVEVVVLNVDRGTRRVALSYKRLREDPWLVVGEHYQVGDEIDAVITHVVHFGAFARVAEGVEGLVHISELSEATFEHPREVVTEGQAVRVRVLHIDAAGRRLGLSLRQAH
jgi:small subunit ribosomal protein S1